MQALRADTQHFDDARRQGDLPEMRRLFRHQLAVSRTAARADQCGVARKPLHAARAASATRDLGMSIVRVITPELGSITIARTATRLCKRLRVNADIPRAAARRGG
jgi:hypothetical protein